MDKQDSLLIKNTFVIDSIQYVIPNKPPALHIINDYSYEESLNNNLKNNIYFKSSKLDEKGSDVNFPSQLIVNRPVVINEINRPGKSFDWFFISFFLLFFILSLIKFQSLKIFNLSLRGAVNKKYVSALSREGDFFKSRVLIFILLYTFLGLALILYTFISRFINLNFEPAKILLLLTAVAFLFLFKLLSFSITGVLFDMKALVSKYIQQIILIDFYIAVCLFPIAFVYNYYPFIEIAITGGILLTMLFIFRIVRGFLIFNAKFLVYENFLYFCTLEILPLLLSVKFVVNYV